MTRMQVVRLHQPGGPQALRLEELPVPQPGPGQVLVRNHAAGVGRPDVLVRTGRYAWMPALPAIIGIESAGTVEQLGEGVTGWQPGDPVYVNARDLPERSGGYAQYRLAPAHALHRLHPGADLLQAAGLGNYQVAECLLRMGGGFPAPRSVAVFGAAGGVGSAAVQLARARGWTVVGIAGSDAKCEFARAQGAQHVINHRAASAPGASPDTISQTTAAAILAATGGQGVDLLLDIASGDTLPPLVQALAPLGVIVSYAFAAGEPPPDTVPALRRRFGASPGWRLFSMHALDQREDLRRDVTTTVLVQFAAGVIRPPVGAVFPLEQAQQAHALFDSQAYTGKIVLSLD